MLSAEYVSRLDDDADRLAALTYCAREGERYPPGLFVPPMVPPSNDDRDKPLIALAVHARRSGEGSSDIVDTVELFDGDIMVRDFPPDDGECAAWLAKHLLCKRLAGSLVVANSAHARMLDLIVETIGPHLVRRGYQLDPILGSEGIAWMKIRRGHSVWTITLPETMAGVRADILRAYAVSAEKSAVSSWGPSRSIYVACAAYSRFLRENFGTALRPTVGMIASACARRHLPESVLKWRPDPLLISLERNGLGYRGGVTFGRKFRGSVHRIDVNRQYTAALKKPLPLRSAFGKYAGPDSGQEGVYVFTVSSPRPLSYPVGIYEKMAGRFRYGHLAQGTTVCILHTSELPALWDNGCRLEGGYGFTFTEMFSLASYVAVIEGICKRFGKDSPAGKLTKPLGNMVYGKYGQRPDRWALCYALERPQDDWHPYIDPDGHDVPGVWERETSRYTSGMHVDIASHITGYARAQTVQTWALLDALGYRVVRAHTDSLSCVHDPRDIIECSDETIGEWRYDSATADATVVGANAFSDSGGIHIAGVRSPTLEMLRELHEIGATIVVQEQHMPRVGWTRGMQTVRRRLTARQ